MSSMVFNMVGGSPDKTVYSGTLTFDIVTTTDTLTIDTGVTISEDAIFLLLPRNITNPYNNYEFFSAGRLNKDFRFVMNTAEDTATGMGRMESAVDQSSGLFVNYSGSVVTINCSSIPYADAGTYVWYLLQ